MSTVKDLFPWVICNTKTYDIVSVGTFEGLSKTNNQTNGHLMTYTTWRQIVEERNISPKKDLISILENCPV